MVKFLLWIVLSHFQFQCQFRVDGVFSVFLRMSHFHKTHTHTLTKESAISDWKWLEMHIIQLVKSKRWMKKGQAKCSFVLEWQHTNLHLFNDLFVSFEFSVSSHVRDRHTHFDSFSISFFALILVASLPSFALCRSQELFHIVYFTLSCHW